MCRNELPCSIGFTVSQNNNYQGGDNSNPKNSETDGLFTNPSYIRNMIVKSSEFVTSAVKPSQYPPADMPEVAFAGRSNVGKSSLINTIINRKRLVKTSSTPGYTRLINFFTINAAFFFVDLPGYGYAKVPIKVKKQWGPMVETYLSTRKTLKGVALIMDIRRIPGPEELQFIEWLDHIGLPSVLILTKTDKLSKTKQLKQNFAIAKALDMDPNGLILFSAKTRQGKDAVWDAIEGLGLAPQESYE